MVVENLPTAFSNVSLMMPDLAENRPPAALKPEAVPASAYPNIELSILNRRGQVVAATFIVEHKEEYTALTLHLRAPDPQEQYIARGEMIYQEQSLQVVEIPFVLNQDRPTHE
jgi:hypothetical protein